MANRDVNLIIRAKNEASKTLTGVTDAINLLKGAQEKLAQSAGRTDGSLGALTDELARLNTAAQASDSLDKAAQQIEVMASAVDRLQAELAATQARLDNFRDKAAQNTEQIKSLEAAGTSLLEQQKREKAALDQAKQATLKKSEAVKALAAAQKELNAATKLPVTDANRDGAISAANVKVESAKAIIEANNRALAQAREALDRTTEATRRNRTELRQLIKVNDELAGEIDKTEQIVLKQNEALNKGRSEYDAVQTTYREASQALQGFRVNAQEAEKSTSSLTAEIERLGRVGQALMRYATGSGTFIDPRTADKMRKVRAETEAAEASWKSLEEEIRRTAQSINGAATPEQQQRMKQLAEAARAAKTEYRQLAEQLHRISGAGQTVAPMFPGVATEGQRLEDAQKGVTRSTKETGEAVRKLGTETERTNLSMFKLNRESRMAMSIFQRLRGEVLSLAASYVGLFGVITGVGNSIHAIQKIEAAQNRLGVVFDQSGQKVTAELQWLQAQAARLGIEFGLLSDQYTKFAVSANAANFAIQDTRAVFLAVAEAGRVNKLSMEDMNGIFLAVTQMIQKGKVSAEELRGQLAERLPSAVVDMAAAFGYGRDQLDDFYKAMAEGDLIVNSARMLAFADELNKRYGPQLTRSLQGTTAQIGKFQNNLFQAQLQFANGGFLEGFNALLAKMNEWFESREGHDFFMALGAAAGRFAQALTVLVDNFDLVVMGVQTLIALKMASWLTGAIDNFLVFRQGILETVAANEALHGSIQSRVLTSVRNFGVGLRTAGANALIFGSALTTGAGRATLAARAMTMLSGATAGFTAKTVLARTGALALTGALGALRGAAILVQGVFAAFGGWIGIITTAVSLLAVPLVTGWLGGVEDVNRATDEHQRILNSVLEKYDLLKQKTQGWADVVKSVTLPEADANLREMNALYQDAIQTVITASKNTITTDMGLTGGFNSEVRSYTRRIHELGQELEDGRITIIDYNRELAKLYSDTDNQKIQEYLFSLIEQGKAAEQAGIKTAQAAEVAQGFGSKLVDIINPILGQFGLRLKETAEAQEVVTAATVDSTEAHENFRAKLQEIRDIIPQIGSELEDLPGKEKLDEAFAGAVEAARTMGELALAVRDYNLALDGLFSQQAGQMFGNFTSGLEASKAAIRQFESFSPTAYWDVNAFRAGYGSDTITLADGTINKITEGMRVSVADAERDLTRRIGEFQSGIVSKIGIDRWAQFNAAQQAALTSIAYNYGSLPDRILSAVRSGTDQEIAQAIRGLGGDNNGINKNRRNMEAGMFVQGESWASEVKVHEENVRKAREEEEKITEEKRKQAEELAKQQAETEQALADMGFENDMLVKRSAGMEREAFIEEGIRNLRQQNANITQEQIDRATELLGRQYDLNAALEAEKNKKSEIEVIEERINNLQAQRGGLVDQREFYQSQGNTGKVQEITSQIANVDGQLISAIQSARALYAAMGGPEADAAIAKFDALILTLQGTNDGMKTIRFTAEEIQTTIFNTLESGIVGVFDSFAQAIANGEDAITALRNAFRKFAADFLMQIAKMILQQALFNTLQSISKSIGGGIMSLASFHTGGIVGASAGSGNRSVAPAWFNSAVRYHTGGIAGLRPNEVPAVLEIGEEVLTESNPRHIRNAGGARQGGSATKVVNLFDAASFLSESLKNVIGEDAILNYVRANPAAWKQALEG